MSQAGELTNTARISAVDQSDSNPSNDVASATVTASSTETISGVIRDAVFNGEGPGSVLQSPPLASATVEILVNGSVVDQTTTDAGGLFSFSVAGSADRVIRITASGTVPETGDPVSVVKEIPLTDLSRAYQIPLTLAIQKRSLIYQLENRLIPFFLPCRRRRPGAAGRLVRRERRGRPDADVAGQRRAGAGRNRREPGPACVR